MRVPCLSYPLILLAVSDLGAATYVVRPDGTGDFPTIQAAIDAVSNGDTIELTDGTFTGTSNRDIDLRGKGITIRSQSGDPATCVIDCEGTELDQHRGLLFQSGEDETCSIEGITITNGYVHAEFPYLYGGGIFITNTSTPAFRNCHVSNCYSDGGGGVYIAGASSPSFDDCTINDNWVGDFIFGGSVGGGFLIGAGSTPTIRDCNINGNDALDGGGIWSSADSSPEITDCEFVSNSAAGAIASGSGGGILCSGSTLISGCLFARNSAGSNFSGTGAGISAGGYARILDCVIEDNTADGGYAGAALGGNVVMERCTIEGNIGYERGGMHVGDNVTLVDCLVIHNGASNGGGIWVGGGAPTLTRCTVTENESGDGGGLYVRAGAVARLTNTIVWGNCVYGQGANIYLAGNVNADCSDIAPDGIEGPGELILGPNVIRLDPLFCDPADCDVRSEPGNHGLREDSPCAPANSPAGCGLIGARDVGCGPSAIEPATWGRVKHLYH